MSTDLYALLPDFLGILLIGLLFFLFGLLIAWMLWRKCKERAEQIERDNKKLQSEYDSLRREVNKLEAA
jgi:cell division protein FtsB